VIRTFGREWYAITNAPLPLVSLNGGIVGYLREDAAGGIVFEEIEAFPLKSEEIDEVLAGVRGLLDNGIDELLVFYYPRDWTVGEIIWTPVAEKIDHLRDKYRSASSIVATDVEDLREALMRQDICMIFLLVEAPEDRLMAYQHAKRSSFVTRQGVDKLFGARAAAAKLGVDLGASVGCGDTPMDAFLAGVGLAVHVGPLDLEYKGLLRTVKIASSLELGELLFRLGRLYRGATQ
jgi:hydroxymethylpyrimidine pyrophosphatase-like HAD family hydrolase